FDVIMTLIENHPIFHNESNNPQFAISLQLANFLVWAGHYVNAASCNDVAKWAGVWAGTVVLLTKRAVVTLISLHDMVMCKPTNEEKIKSKAYAGLKVCPSWQNSWFSVDGTIFPLFQKPNHFGDVIHQS
ncbi:hypothetical protein SERLA73DRAFT_63177, partial [Serpula lacrymans var. lacrymans S7.3]